MGPSQVERLLFGAPEFVFLEILANGAQNPPPTQAVQLIQAIRAELGAFLQEQWDSKSQKIEESASQKSQKPCITKKETV